MKIIIAAETGTDRKFIRRYLEFAGYRGSTFYEAWNKESLIERAVNEAVDIIFIDLDWPKIKLSQIMARLESKHKVVALSAFLGQAKKQHILDQGVALIINNPLSSKKIRSAISASPLYSSLKEISNIHEQFGPFTHLLR